MLPKQPLLVNPIVFRASQELRDELIALSYFYGMRGEISKSIRYILQDAIPRIKDNMARHSIKRYEEILETVRATSALSIDELLLDDTGENGDDGNE